MISIISKERSACIPLQMMQATKIMQNDLHFHTEFSLNDGVSTPKQCVTHCKLTNKRALAITDHGHAMAHDAFRAAFAADSEVTTKLIYGVEAYVLPKNSYVSTETDDEDEDTMTAHLVLLAKDNIGLHTLYHLMTASYGNTLKGKPVMTQESLMSHVGPGTEGHGHIIAMSACMQGVLSVHALHNAFLEKAAMKIERKAARINLDVDHYAEIQAKAEETAAQLDALKEKRANASTLKGKKFTARERAVAKLQGTPEYASARAQLDADIAASEQAAIDYANLKEEEGVISKSLTALKGELRKLESKATKYQSYLEQAEEVRAQAIDDAELYDNTAEAAQYYLNLFGPGNFYAELQYHGIPEEEICFPLIAMVAEELGIPVVATNDSHYITNDEKTRKTRQILRSLRFNRWCEELVGDDQLGVKTDEEMRETLCQVLPLDVVNDAIANTFVIADQCNVTFPKEEHYPKFISPDGKSALEKLKEMCNEKFKEYRRTLPREQWKVYVDRTRYEVDVINKLGVADYLLIVQDFLEYGRLLGYIDLEDPRFLADPFNIELIKELGKGNVGMSIGIGRGSAVGSLVSFLIGITAADPIQYGLLFERFLNTERVTMPDIDSDFAPEVRGKVLDYVKHKYGEAAVCCIATIGTQAVKGSIRNCARLLGDEKYGSPKALLALGAEICDAVPREVGIQFKDCIDMLRDKFQNNADAIEILDNALLVEGTFTQVGMHAAGVIISDNDNVGDYIPLMKSKDDQWVSQYDMNHIEARGLLKMDVRLVR